MVKIFLLLIFTTTSSIGSIWDDDYQGVKWHTDYEQAKALAKEKNLPILLYFSGSDWCSFCIRLDKKILTKKTFQQYAEKHMILVNVDFPSNKELPSDLVKQNKTLKKQFGANVVPYFVMVNSKDGKMMGAFSFTCLPLICTQNKFMKKLNLIYKEI
jgi:protein disulfide-isomerase